jgi:phytol kinase
VNPWLGVAVVIGLLAAMFGVLKLYEVTLKPHPEVLRKLMHVGTGLVVLTFPWVFASHRWPPLVLAGVGAIALAAVRFVPMLKTRLGGVLTGVSRLSWGEIYYPVAVAVLWVLADGDWLLFAVPMLIMTLADAMAALVGIAYGKIRYITSDGLKSAEGSIAFFSIAFLSVLVPLLWSTEVGRRETLLIAVIIGLLAMLLEAIAWRGLDNLLIPIGAYAFLKLYLDEPYPALLYRLYVTIGLTVFALAWRRRTSLDDSALMGCALFGYAAWMLGGWVWLIGPAALFMIHTLRFPREKETRTHHMYAVVSVTSAALLWLGFYVAHEQHYWLYPWAIVFGTHMTIIGVSWISTHASPQNQRTRLAFVSVVGWLLAAVQMLPLCVGPWRQLTSSATAALMMVALATIAAGAIAFYRLRPHLYSESGSNLQIHLAGFVIGLVASAVAAGVGVIVQ